MSGESSFGRIDWIPRHTSLLAQFRCDEMVERKTKIERQSRLKSLSKRCLRKKQTRSGSRFAFLFIPSSFSFYRPREITKKDVITEQQIKFLNFLLKYNNLNCFSKQADRSLNTGITGLSRNGSQAPVAQTVKGRDHKTKRFLDFLLK